MSILSNILAKPYASGQINKLLYLSDGLTIPLMYDGDDLVSWGVYPPADEVTVAATSTGSNAVDLAESLWIPASTVIEDGEDAWSISSSVTANAVASTSTDAKLGSASAMLLLGTNVEPVTSSTKLLLHGNGTNGSTSIIDSSASPHTATIGGDAQLSTAAFKFGTASMYFDGTGDYISFASSSDWNFGTGDFTIDFWVNVTSHPTHQCIFDTENASTGGGNGVAFVYMGGTNSLRVYINGSNVIDVATTLSLSTWYHVGISRSGTSLKLFLNGAQIGSATNSSSITTTFPFYIGINGLLAAPFNGYIDEFRVDKGLARFTATFAVPNMEYGDFSTLSNDPLSIFGPVMYETISSMDLSGYYGVSFWIKSSKAQSAADLQLVLFDSNGAVDELERIDIPALIPETWTKVTAKFQNPSLLTTVQSVALWLVADHGTNVIKIDDIRAIRCKVSLDANDRVEGATSVKLEVPGNIPNNVTLAYKNISSTDFTGDTVVLMSLKCSSAIGFQALQYQLDESADLASPDESMYITDNLEANVWNNLTLDIADNTDLNAVISHGLKITNRNIAPCTIWIDNIQRASVASGNLSGRYFVWVSFYSSKYDRESDLSPISTVVDTNGQGIALSNIPISDDPQVDMRKIYRSAAGGTVPYFDTLIPDNSTTTLTLNRSDASLVGHDRHPSLGAGSGKFQPPPACPFVVQFKNRFILAGTIPYTRGTVDVTANDATFTFDKAEIDLSFIGRKLIITGETDQYIILAVDEMNKEVIARPFENLETGTYKGSTASGKSYQIIGDENTVYSSFIDDNDVPRPHGFPLDQAQEIVEGKAGDQITALGLVGDTILVTKRHSSHILEGAFPPYTNNRISETTGCIAYRTMQQDEKGNAYWLAGEAGIAYTDGFKVDLISNQLSNLFDGSDPDLSFNPEMYPEAHAIYDTTSQIYYIFLASAESDVNDTVLLLDKSRPDQNLWRWYYYTGIEAACSTIVYDNVTGESSILIGDYDGFLSELNVGYLDCVSTGTVSGTITGHTTNTLTDSTASFKTTGDGLKAVPVIAYNVATGNFSVHKIASNTATSITIEDTWGISMTGVIKYYIGAYELAWRSKNIEPARPTDKNLVFDTVINHAKHTASRKLRLKVKKNLAGTTIVNQLIELNAGEENVLLIRQRVQQVQWELTGFCHNENIEINSVGLRFRPRGIR